MAAFSVDWALVLWLCIRTDNSERKITSEGGEPLIGATVAVKNSTDGTVTDIDGNYSLKTKKTLTQRICLYSVMWGIKRYRRIMQATR